MNVNEGWELIRAQFKRNRRVSMFIGLGMATVLVGVVVTIFYRYVGIPIMLTGVIMSSVVPKLARNHSVDVDSIYERKVLQIWLNEIFDEPRFTSKATFKKAELERLDWFNRKLGQIVCNRSFTAKYKGVELRAADVSVEEPYDGPSKHSRYDFSEPDYIFWGRVWEINKECDINSSSGLWGFTIEAHDGKTYIIDNHYSETGAYPIWLAAPDNDSCDIDELHNKAINEILPYVEYLSSVTR